MKVDANGTPRNQLTSTLPSDDTTATTQTTVMLQKHSNITYTVSSTGAMLFLIWLLSSSIVVYLYQNCHDMDFDTS